VDPITAANNKNPKALLFDIHGSPTRSSFVAVI